MLRLSRSRGSSQAAQYEDAKRLEHAVEARAAAEEALSQARVSNKELQARIAELEGAPAAREHAASVRALEGANARLTAKLEAATHEQKVLGDVVAEKERDVEQLQHRLRSVEHGSTQHDTRASRLHAELEEARLALAEERKHRYLAEDRLRLAERHDANESGRRVQAAELQLAAVEAEGAAREERIGQLRGTAEAAAAERDALRAQLAELATAGATKDKELAEARSSLELVRAAFSTGGTVVDVSTEAAAEAQFTLAEEALKEGGDVEAITNLARRLRNRALTSASLEAEVKALEEEMGNAREGRVAAEEQTVAVEAELEATKRALQLSDSTLSELRRSAAVPVLGDGSNLQQQAERLHELSNVTVPTLERERAEAAAALGRCEVRLATEREAKSTARAAEAAAREEAQTAHAAAAMAVGEAEGAERARRAAVEQLEGMSERYAALQRQLDGFRARESAYTIRESEVAEAVSTADVKSTLLEEQARLLTLALKEEEGKVTARDEMLRSLQHELQSQRKRIAEMEQRAALASHAVSRADGAQRDAEGEAAEMQEKLTLAMMEVNARAERLEHSQAQVAAARGEIRALENQLAITSSQLSVAQQQNSDLAQAEAAKGAQLASAEGALQRRDARMDAAEVAAGEARAESTARQEELVRVGEKLGAAHEERDLLEHQLLASKHTCALLRTEVELAKTAAKAAKNDARDEQLMRVAHEGRARPLRAALAEATHQLEEADERGVARVVLAERLQTAEAVRVAESERAAAADRRAAASELKATHADERLGMVREELGRRETRIELLVARLGTCEEEIALFKSSKELLVSRSQLQDELNRQRPLAESEEIARRTALAVVKERHVGAADALVRAAGKHAAEAVAGVRELSTQAAGAEREAVEDWSGRMAQLDRVQARGEAAMSELHGRLMAARMEVEASSVRAEELNQRVVEAEEEARERMKELDEACNASFHNHCLLAKVLLNTRRRPENVLVADLYEEATIKGVPITEWPNFVVMRMSGGEPLSAWL